MRTIIVLLVAVLMPYIALASLDDLGLSAVSEQCDRWEVSFDWSDVHGYTKSISHGTSEAGGIGGAKISTDTLVMTSTLDPKEAVKISVLKYPYDDRILANPKNLVDRARRTASEASGCENISVNATEIDGKPGALADGRSCRGGRDVTVAVYSVGFYFDRAIKGPNSNAIGVITSTYSKEATEGLLNSLKIQYIGQ